MHNETLLILEVIFRKRNLQPFVLLLLFSMASAVFYYFACGTNDNIAVAWISAILIFVLGIFYIIIGLFCFSFGDKKESKEELVT